MKKVMNRGGGRRSVRSTLSAVLTLGACSTILTTGLIFVSASPASAAQATKLAFTTQPPTTTVAGATLATFKVLIEDGTNAPATTDLTDSVTISSSCALGGTTVATASGGIATFSALIIDETGACTLTGKDTSRNLTTATSTSVTVSPGSATKLAFTTQPPTTAYAGSSLATFRVSVEDSFGNVITTAAGATDVVTITSPCSLGGTVTASAVAGVATFSRLAIDSAGACTLTATDTSRSLTTAASAAVAVNPDTATKLAFTTEPPAIANVGAVLTSFQVSVEDTFGNVVTTGNGAKDSLTITSSCILGGTATATAVAGVATFSALVINSPATCTLTVTDTSRYLTTATSSVIDSRSAQSALSVTSLAGTIGKTLTLTTSGGSGTGAVTFNVTNGTATGCTVSGSSLTVSSVGTCIVTATKAASTTNQAVSSPATTVKFSVAVPKARRVIGAAWVGRTVMVKIVGTNFYGRPRVISNVAGVKALVTGDSGTLLTVRVTVNAGVKTGVHTFTIILANGKRTSVKFNLR